MATVEDIKAAIAAEAAEVKAKVDELEAKIAELSHAGGGATPEQLDELLAGVRGIFTPPAEPQGGGGPGEPDDPDPKP